MLREIVVAIVVSVMLLGGMLSAQAEDRDRDRDRDRDDRGSTKGEHRSILNSVNSGNTQQGQLSKEITPDTGGHQGILDAVTGGTSSSNAAHTTLQSEHATQNTAHTTQDTAHGTLQGEHASQNTAQDAAHTTLSGKLEAVQAAVDKLSGGGGGTTDLKGVTQNWDKTLPANDPGGACPSNSTRFTCVMGGQAVRDNETGLVWEREPAPTPASWGGGGGARFQCTAREIGGRRGWRLPSFAELSSLVDPSVGSPGPSLPTGHPFTNVLSVFYWSATADAGNLNPQGALILQSAWGVNFGTGIVGTLLKTFTGFVWCVRGGTHADLY
jgi:hypothetical protein